MQTGMRRPRGGKHLPASCRDDWLPSVSSPPPPRKLVEGPDHRQLACWLWNPRPAHAHPQQVLCPAQSTGGEHSG